jgi:hypothetical protein
MSLPTSAPNQALEPTPYSLRYAPASGRGSPPAFGAKGAEEKLGVNSPERS